MENAQLKGLLNTLKNSNHPEMTHFRKGHHPGKTWYLKTVCPVPELEQIDRLSYGEIWQALSEEYPKIVQLLPQAYDWDGNEIPYMVSVWIDEENDIIFNYNKDSDQMEITFTERYEGFQVQIMKMKYIITTERDMYSNNGVGNTSEIMKYNKELDGIMEIVDKLHGDLNKGKITRSPKNVKKFKIIKGGKINKDDESS